MTLARPIALEHVYGSSPHGGEDCIYPPPTGKRSTNDVSANRRFSASIMSERTIEGLRIHIDRDLCVSFGDCVDAAPGVFALDEEDIAVFVDEIGAISREEMIEACSSCPVDALTAFDEDGKQLAP